MMVNIMDGIDFHKELRSVFFSLFLGVGAAGLSITTVSADDSADDPDPTHAETSAIIQKNDDKPKRKK